MGYITIDIYKREDFKISEKAIWLVGVRRDAGLVPLYANFFLKSDFIAKYTSDNYICIPRSTMLKFKDSLDSFYQTRLPRPVKSISVDFDEWKAYLSKNKLINRNNSRR